MNKSFRVKKSNKDIQINEVKAMLSKSYWANDRDIETIKRSIDNSVCFGAYSDEDNKQVGFARVITDYATMYYICDVIVNEDCRGNGIGKAIVDAIVTDELFCNMRGLLLTGDAHELYKKYGFNTVDGRLMIKPKTITE